MTKLTKEYAAALEASRVASRKYAAAQQAYRTGKIGDAEYLAARAEHDQATRVFDAAFAKEAYGRKS